MNQLRYLAVLLVLTACKTSSDKADYTTWEAYGGGKENIHYSSLKEIDTGNVSRLQVAWTFHTGDADTSKSSQIQCNPIIVDSIMYLVSPTLKLFAVHAGSGQKIWEFDPKAVPDNLRAFHFIMNNSRGVTYWTDGKDDKRIFFVAGSYIHSIDAATGKLVTSFGNQGKVDLHDGLGRDVRELYVTATSPGIIYKDLFIMGTRVDEGPAAAPGHIRAFDTRTGKLQWIFHTIPQPGEFGYDTWEDSIAYKNIGGANSWSGLSMDEKRGILFVPTGSASFDFYGGMRKGQNLFGNCLIALDAATGTRKWHFQFIHHDVWDWDLPCAPALVTIHKDGKTIDAVAQPTKQGMLFVFDRETGTPVYPIREMPVDTANALPGEKLWPTQPFSTGIKPYARQSFTEADLNPYLSDTSLARVKKELQGYNYGKPFIVPSKKTRVQLPGFDGGAEWGGPTYDPETGLLYINSNEMGWLVTLRDIKPAEASKETYAQAGIRLYQQYCVTCHGADRKGSGNYPTLINIQAKYSPKQAIELLNSGRRMMPSFNHIADEEKNAILSYVLERKTDLLKEFRAPHQAIDSFRNLPYGMTGYYKFLSPEGYPAIGPPWGHITAIDLNTGEHVWKQNLGEIAELKAKGIPPTGTENYGGSVVTGGGLLFIAAARDGKLRAFNKHNGQLLWEYDLPAPGFATPSVYQWNGKQYLVIACGGGKLGTRSSDSFVAFSLPEK
jgi:quinoprotein glucose dehydrogenase